MSNITGFHIHRGTLALVHRPSAESLDAFSVIDALRNKQEVTLLLAEGITNVDNLGALFRNAAAFGVDAIILDSACCDPLYRKAIRVSMGHALSIRWAIAEDWIESLKQIHTQLGVKLVGCETGTDATPIWDVDPTAKVGLIVGEEKTGLSASTIAMCDEIAEIPMMPQVPSLNVAVASAVGLYEFLCRNRFNNG